MTEISNKDILQVIMELSASLTQHREETNARFEQMVKRLEQVEKRFEQIDRRFEQIDKQFQQVNEQSTHIDNQLATMNERIEDIAAGQKVFATEI